MKWISLTQGKTAIVDDGDYDDLRRFEWCAHWEGGNWYAVRNLPRVHGQRTVERMHRRLLGLKPGDKRQGDHIHHNTLDNRRSELRICTHKQNHENMQSHRGTSNYKGVHWHKQCQKWRALICVNGKEIHLGLFATEAGAARAYDRAALKYFGEYACVNISSIARS